MLALSDEVGVPAVGDDLDQAVVDAEFEAIVLAEAPWGESLGSPAPTPPRARTTVRLDPAPHGPDGSAGGAGRWRPRAEQVTESTRRRGAVARSPPR